MSQSLSDLRHRIRAASHADEPDLVAGLLDGTLLSVAERDAVRADAIAIVEACRGRSHKAGTLDAFLQEFGLSNDEGIALMCLAEALLRVPDDETADRLIAEKIRSGNWGAHKGRSASRFVNASVWGLMLTGRIVRLDADITEGTDFWMQRLVSKLGEPVVRQAVLQAMKIMGSQYVLGRTIEEGMRKGREGNRPGTRFSYDMLGEGARTGPDAKRYFDNYVAAIDTISRAGNAASVIDADGISLKLSALHPRYSFRQRARVMHELLPRVLELARLARAGGLGFTIDAEECDRLDISLDIFEALARDDSLVGWDGLGFVLQTYQKRAPAVTDWLIALGRDTGRRLMVRVVKGAYWDGEIKHAQEQGLADYPVFTRKCHTDLCFEHCAAKLLAAPDAVFGKFATHNAYSAALVRHLAGASRDYEFQRLHGMGQLLYEQLHRQDAQVPVRVYAPVGNHRDLLPYLVRRLLENGANSSFVNRFLDAKVSAETLITDPAEEARRLGVGRHSRIPVPRRIYRDERAPWENAAGIDLSDPDAVAPLLEAVQKVQAQAWRAAPIVGGQWLSGETQPVRNPARREQVLGEVVEADAQALEQALSRAMAAQAEWNARGVEVRAAALERAAELYEAHCCELIALIAAEAGRTLDDGLSEVREAVDFLRYYAQQARLQCPPRRLPGPTGELNELSLHGRGVFLCISPWNFPLAIFTGQIAAALAVGNTVLAKPAEQTPLVAARAVTLLQQAGVPGDVLHLLPGDGARVGAALVADERVAGVAFTGSTATAKLINRQIAERDGPIVPLIAETGGLNVMLVDGTALPEQVVDDVIGSAFRSAGQRCSALRVLYLQEDIADTVLTMLAGAMRELTIGDPGVLATDIGPVIDLEARQMLERHVERMEIEATRIAVCDEGEAHREGYFFMPRVYEIRRLSQLPGEVFGPILHVIRYRMDDMPKILADINASGYGLTLGIHSRIDGFAREVFNATRVGNTYVNRNMVGAVVGVNPFGGQGLSGTGPKAGGPNYLLRFGAEKTRTDNVVAKGGNAQLFNLGDDAP
jgi:RHH-type proline utilization regulon transcriptional repressor/proline dehydrogenase/delta 1-pyrroline-5-carboxylate dehydrogenase